MIRPLATALCASLLAIPAAAQDFYAGSVGGNEPLYEYDDQEPWKHGYLHIMPYYGGFHHGRPYNYHHVFSQTQTSVGWGMPHGLPYSQQWWHRFEGMADPGRAQTEPGGWYGPVNQPANDPFAQPLQPHIAPVQFQQPSPAIHPLNQPTAGTHPYGQARPLPVGVNPGAAAVQSQQMRHYLTTPSR